MYMFLFDDILLLTRVKKSRKRGATSGAPVTTDAGSTYSTQRETGATFVVYRQPIALDRFTVHDVLPPDTAAAAVALTASNKPPHLPRSARDPQRGTGSAVEHGCDVDTAAASSAAVGPGAVETRSFRTASGGSGTGGGGSGVCVNPICVTVTSEPPSTHESCLPHDCNRHLLFGCLSAAANALSNAFVLVQVSRFQQIIGVFTLQAPTEVAKDTWLSRLHDAQTAYRQACKRTDSLLTGTSTIPRSSALGEQEAIAATAQKTARRRQQQRVGGGIETSSSSAMDRDAQTALRRANSRKMRSSSSDAATSTDVEAPPRPVSPRRISDPIGQRSDSQVHLDTAAEVSMPPSLAAPIVTTAQMHPEGARLIAVPVVAEIESQPVPPACLPGELYSETDSGGVLGSHYHYPRLPSSTPTARRDHAVELQQQVRGGNSSSLGSLHQRLISSVSVPPSPPPTASGPRPIHGGDPWSCRGVVPGHLLYRRPAACRSETASPVIDDDDDDDDGINSSSSARDRPHHASWHVRRHLKAISERSQSSDTIYV